MELWTAAHAKTLIPAVVGMLLLGILLRLWLGKKELRIRLIPLQIIACLLLLLEIGKQGVSLGRGYDLYHLPFHFCSLYIFAIPWLAFSSRKTRTVAYEVVPALGASLFLLMLIYPALIYGAWDIENFFTEYMSFHTVAFHNLVMLATVLVFMLDIQTEQTGKRTGAVIWLSVVFCIVSSSMAQLLKTNYANFYSCNIPPLEAVRTGMQSTLGYGLTQLLYILAVAVLTVLFVLLSYWVSTGIRRWKDRLKIWEKQKI